MYIYIIILAAVCKALCQTLKTYLIQKNIWLEAEILVVCYFCMSKTRHISRVRLCLALHQCKQLAGNPAEQRHGPLRLWWIRKPSGIELFRPENIGCMHAVRRCKWNTELAKNSEQYRIRFALPILDFINQIIFWKSCQYSISSHNSDSFDFCSLEKEYIANLFLNNVLLLFHLFIWFHWTSSTPSLLTRRNKQGKGRDEKNLAKTFKVLPSNLRLAGEGSFRQGVISPQMNTANMKLSDYDEIIPYSSPIASVENVIGLF